MLSGLSFKPRLVVRSLAVLLLAGLAFAVSQWLGFGLFYVLNDFEYIESPKSLAGVQAGVLACGLLLFILIAKLAKKSFASFYGLKKPTWADLGYSLLGFGMYFLLASLALALMSMYQVIDTGQEQALPLGDGPLAGLDLVYIMFAVLIVPPIYEELLFRGLLFRQLKKTTGYWLAGIVSSLLFGLVHAQWNVAVDTFILSMVMVYVLSIRDNLLTSILIHTFKNGLTFYFLFVLGT